MSSKLQPTILSSNHANNLTLLPSNIKHGDSIKQFHDQIINRTDITSSREELKHLRV